MDGLRFIKHCAEFRPMEDISKVPHKMRGIYALLDHNPKDGPRKGFDVVYIGMSRTGIRGRLEDHKKKKAKSWTHFSAYSVWPNITDEEIIELEGLFRAIYRRDPRANKLAVQRSFKKLRHIRDDTFSKWD